MRVGSFPADKDFISFLAAACKPHSHYSAEESHTNRIHLEMLETLERTTNLIYFPAYPW